MPRYVLVIGDRRLAVFDAPNFDRANSLKDSADLAAALKDTSSVGVPLWNGSDPVEFRLPEPHEEEKWQAQHRANNAEFGLSDDQGLFLWLVPVDSDDHEVSPWFSMKDEWGLW
jgi:hypothetical protein